MAEVQSEYQLLINFKEAKDTLFNLKEMVTEAQKKFDQAESQLIEYLREGEKEATARYQGLGYVGLNKPVIYASIAAEKKDEALKFLRSRKRGDLIQKTVNSRSLSTFIKELMEAGRKVPECISYYLKTSARFYAEK